MIKFLRFVRPLVPWTWIDGYHRTRTLDISPCPTGTSQHLRGVETIALLVLFAFILIMDFQPNTSTNDGRQMHHMGQSNTNGGSRFTDTDSINVVQKDGCIFFHEKNIHKTINLLQLILEFYFLIVLRFHLLIKSNVKTNVYFIFFISPLLGWLRGLKL